MFTAIHIDLDSNESLTLSGLDHDDFLADLFVFLEGYGLVIHQIDIEEV